MRSYHIFRTWAQEAFAIALAIGLIASIASVLVVYNGKPVPDWGSNLNLNALLAFLSTILRALLVIIVAQIISQRKWDWYSDKRARPLADLQQFDDGSRGAWGALLLIPTVLSKDFVTLSAAVVLLVSFLVGPTVQQASGTAPCSFPSSAINASLPFAHWVPGKKGYFPDPSMGGIPTADLISAILSSVVSPDGIENQISTSCATGNCTFGDLVPDGSQDTRFNDDNRTTHSTVGVCSICTDVASLVTSRNKTTQVTSNYTSHTTIHSLPSGFNISTNDDYVKNAIGPTPDLDWMGTLLTESIREASRWAYVNATLLDIGSTSNTGNDPIAASVCSLYPCLRTYRSVIRDNRLQEQETQSKPMRVQLTGAGNGTLNELGRRNVISDPHDYAAIESPCRIEGRTFHEGDALPDDIATTDLQLVDTRDEQYTSTNVTWPEQCIYRQDAGFFGAVSDVMSTDIFNGHCFGVEFGQCSRNDGDPSSYVVNVGVDAVLQSLMKGNSTHSVVTRVFDAVANAITSSVVNKPTV